MKKVCFVNPRLPMFFVAKASETPTPDIGRIRFATTYAFLPVYSHIIIINVCECCVDYINMLMQWKSITVINILTMFVYCIISDHTDGTVIQRGTNNIDACTHCSYLFFVLLFENNDVIGAPNKILPRAPRVLLAILIIYSKPFTHGDIK